MVFVGHSPMTGVDLICMRAWLAKVGNSLNGSKTIRRCFFKSGFADADTDTVFLRHPISKTGNIVRRGIDRESSSRIRHL